MDTKDKQTECLYDHYPEQPSHYDQIVAGIEYTGIEQTAELIEYAVDALTKALRQNKDQGKRLRHIREAKSALSDIYAFDSDDPRLNGWVDDKGRP